MKTLCAIAAGVALFAAPALNASAADRPVLRHLAYTFTWGVQNSTEEQTSGIGESVSGSGISNYKSGTNDKGEIDVDILGAQPDSGVILRVSEKGESNRSAPAAECVVYGTTAYVCQNDVRVNEEEFAIVRLLGTNFYDPVKLDTHKHWNVTDNGANFSFSADYTIASQNADLLGIDETRNVTATSPSGKLTTQVTGKVAYDRGKTIPVELSEYTIERGNGQHIGDHSTTTTTVDIKLASDSGVKNP